MKVFINKTEKIVPHGCSVKQLLEIIGKNNNYSLAVAIGNSIVPRCNWEEVILNENDALTIIEATCGG